MTNGYVPTNQGCNAYVCNFPDLKTNALCGYPLVKVQEGNLCLCSPCLEFQSFQRGKTHKKWY